MAVEDSEAVRKSVEAARKRPPAADDTSFQYLQRAKVGSPVLVYTPGGEPLFWIVPLLVKTSACGFARVELSHKVTQMGIFGSGPEDQSSWIDATYFRRPSPETLATIQARYADFQMSEPVFSYDTSPSKWAWRIEMREGGEIKFIIFIAPHGWYEKQLDERNTELEG